VSSVSTLLRVRSTPTRPHRRLIVPGQLLLASAQLLFLLESWAPAQQMDDAYISYRYAQNLIDGHGLVFNPGERVEGYTNLSWTLVVAAAIRLGIPAPLAGHWISLLSGAWLLWLSGRYAALLLPANLSWTSGLVPLVLLASNSFACWTASGLETPLFAAAGMAALYAYARGRIGRALAYCIFASLTRPEGWLLAGLLLGWDWLLRVHRLRPLQFGALLRLSWPVLGFAAYLLLHTAFRLYYYDDFVPNTFRAKVGGIPLSRGWSYVYNFFVDGPALLILPAIWAAWKLPRYRIGFVYLGSTIVYVFAIGGDAFRLGRFLLPVLPILIAGALGAACLVHVRHGVSGVALGLLLPLSVVWALYGSWPLNPDFVRWRQRHAAHDRLVEIDPQLFLASAKRLSARKHDQLSEAVARRTVAALGRLDPPVRSIAVIAIGEIGFFGRNLHVIDLVGLTDRHIARSEKRIEGASILPGHQRTDAAYVFARKPDAILVPRKGGANTLRLPALLDIWNDPHLVADYEWKSELRLYLRKPELRGREDVRRE
jgi:hypothetical protein